jgi:xanthine dehydrogenase accessory factor
MVNHRLQASIALMSVAVWDVHILRAAVATGASYHAFAGSRRKMAAVREKLIAEGVDASALDAMSILAEITFERRRGQRGAGVPPHRDDRWARQREPDSPATILSFNF